MSDDHDVVLAQLREFLCRTMLDPEQASLLEPDTSLRQLGVLNSVGLARLVAFVRDELGVEVPLRRAAGGGFRTLNDMAAVILSIRAERQPESAVAAPQHDTSRPELPPVPQDQASSGTGAGFNLAGIMP